jgi:hypothetical protein
VVARNRWEKLDEETRAGREAAPGQEKVRNYLLSALKGLAERGHCSKTVQGWLKSEKKKDGYVEIAVQHGDAHDNWSRPAIKLKNLAHLQDGAVLSLMVTLSERAPKGICAYTLGLEGKSKTSGLAWYARIDLTKKPEGDGVCAHPLLHCHMGSKADEAGAPEGSSPPVTPQADVQTGSKRRARIFSPRVPLPWLAPWEAVEWLLATVDPSLEPPAGEPPARG